MLKKISIIILGSLLIGIGINGFILPFHLINGGIFGITLILNYMYGFKFSITFMVLNIPIYLLALKSAPLYFLNGVMGAFISGILIDSLGALNGFFHLPIFLSVVCGGLFIGTGVGFMLRNHISPGGMDLLALLISRWTMLNVGIIIYFIDTIIILSGLLILQDIHILYSLLLEAIVGLLTFVITSVRSSHIYLS